MSTIEQSQGEGKGITVTEAARKKVVDIFVARDIVGQGAIRISIVGRGGAGFQYMAVEEEGEPLDDDIVIDRGDYKLFIDHDSWPALQGAVVDYVVQLVGGGFKIENPNPVWGDPLAAGIAELIDRDVNPSVASHGGHVDLIDVKDNVVYLQLGGGCQGCSMVDVTLRQGIEVLIKEAYPEITGVVDTTDHAGGSNPYYQPSKGAGGPSPFYQSAKG